MRRSTDNPWLARFAMLTAVATLFLIGVGGVVTSKGVGMAVPDWPTTYGYNMFLFPWSKWTGGIFWEHSHRLVASGVGLLTTLLAVWLWLKESRAWLRWMGIIAFFAVVAQGVLGGLRVTMYKDELGIFHGCLAQAFLCLVTSIALFLSRWWRERTSSNDSASIEESISARPVAICLTILVFVQLALGATMRHQHAGLAVPDFPLAYGKIWPATDAASLERYNQVRHDHREFNDITAAHIHVHMAHRLTAYAILAAVTWWWLQTRRRALGQKVRNLGNLWLGLVWIQAILGIVTVIKNKPADIATAHVVVGAAILATGVVTSLVLSKFASERAAQHAAQPIGSGALAEARG